VPVSVDVGNVVRHLNLFPAVHEESVDIVWDFNESNACLGLFSCVYVTAFWFGTSKVVVHDGCFSDVMFVEEHDFNGIEEFLKVLHFVIKNDGVVVDIVCGVVGGVICNDYCGIILLVSFHVTFFWISFVLWSVLTGEHGAVGVICALLCMIGAVMSLHCASTAALFLLMISSISYFCLYICSLCGDVGSAR